MDKTALGDRMKEYEVVESGRHFMPLLPVYARIDGRAFQHSLVEWPDLMMSAFLRQ